MSPTQFPIDLNHLPPMPKNKDLGIGCIGAGFIMADIHLVAYRDAGFNPIAIASRTMARCEEVAERHDLSYAYDDYRHLLDNPEIEVVDVAVPPDIQLEVMREIVQRDHIRGILAQKPIARDYAEAKELVDLVAASGKTLAVNQNMRYDHSIRACKSLLEQGVLGEPVLATIDMRAIPHWMEWQERQGFVSLRMMSIHHLDTFRYYLFGDPDRIYASFRKDPRTTFEHEDGICLYILEYDDGFRASGWDDVWTGPVREGSEGDIHLDWRVDGTDGIAKGTIGWPSYPCPTPSTIDFTSKQFPGYWFQPRWEQVWFPDAFQGTMAQLLIALEDGTEPAVSGSDNLKTMALIDAGYQSAREHRAVAPQEIIDAHG